jgi:hypothetical protein
MVEYKKYSFKLLRLTKSAVDETEKPPSRTEIFCNQLMDSAVVGGISGISAFVAAGENAALKVLVIAFALTFLVKLKEYRKIA